jgi:hypothetical protein
MITDLSQRDDPFQATLHRNRRTRHARRLDQVAGRLAHPDRFEFVHLRLELDRRSMHRVGLRQRNDVHDELSGRLNVDERVLQPPGRSDRG